MLEPLSHLHTSALKVYCSNNAKANADIKTINPLFIVVPTPEDAVSSVLIDAGAPEPAGQVKLNEGVVERSSLVIANFCFAERSASFSVYQKVLTLPKRSAQPRLCQYAAMFACDASASPHPGPVFSYGQPVSVT